jgi:hypothetical protein
MSDGRADVAGLAVYVAYKMCLLGGKYQPLPELEHRDPDGFGVGLSGADAFVAAKERHHEVAAARMGGQKGHVQ